MENAERTDAGLANYDGVLTLGVSPVGLYLAHMSLFRFRARAEFARSWRLSFGSHGKLLAG
jgi:hypothetical protein